MNKYIDYICMSCKFLTKHDGKLYCKKQEKEVDRNHYCAWWEEDKVAKALGMLILAKKALKKQLNNAWIPVGERLPDMDECHKNDNRFIVTDGNRRYQDWFDYEEGYFTKCECNGLGLKKDKCVIAWQPLPPAYVEVENEH